MPTTHAGGARMSDTERVLLPAHPRSTKYHPLGCTHIDRDRAAVVRRADAEELGRRPCGLCYGGDRE